MLVSAARMLREAQKGEYAIGQFNLNNLEWIKAILATASSLSAPVILGITETACSYMGGLRTVRSMIEGMIEHMRIKIPVALHLDHSSYAMCLEAIGAGFTSVMFDGSKLPFTENLRICAELAQICARNDVSLEAELGSPAGEEDGISGSGEKASPQQCAQLSKTGITCLAASIGNIHGQYPKNWEGLDFSLLKQISKAVAGLPLALHGGSGIPDAMVAEAISLGIAKINVNTECQIAFAQGLRTYYETQSDLREKGYNLQTIMNTAMAEMEKIIAVKISFFGSAHKASLLQ